MKPDNLTINSEGKCSHKRGITWFIDPQGIYASDSNSGHSPGNALCTYRELTRRWGTTSPVLTRDITIIFLSSQINNSDPITFTPILNGNVTVTIR